MLHGNNPIIKLKVGLNLANKLNNVSHNTFCLYQELVEEGRVHALIEKTRCKANPKNRVAGATEQAVVVYVIEQPSFCQHRTSNKLCK